MSERRIPRHTFIQLHSRDYLSLDGEWEAIPDQYEVFEEHPIANSFALPQASEDDLLNFDIDDGYSIQVPSCLGEAVPEFRHYEVGAGAKWGHHGPKDQRWTEEFQAAVYRDQIDAIEDNEQISGMTPWILFDFRSPSRQNPYQRGYNRKGLLDQRGRKKKAFYLLEEFYRDENE